MVQPLSNLPTISSLWVRALTSVSETTCSGPRLASAAVLSLSCCSVRACWGAHAAARSERTACATRVCVLLHQRGGMQGGFTSLFNATKEMMQPLPCAACMPSLWVRGGGFSPRCSRPWPGPAVRPCPWRTGPPTPTSSPAQSGKAVECSGLHQRLGRVLERYDHRPTVNRTP